MHRTLLSQQNCAIPRKRNAALVLPVEMSIAAKSLLPEEVQKPCIRTFDTLVRWPGKKDAHPLTPPQAGERSFAILCDHNITCAYPLAKEKNCASAFASTPKASEHAEIMHRNLLHSGARSARIFKSQLEQAYAYKGVWPAFLESFRFLGRRGRSAHDPTLVFMVQCVCMDSQ